MAQRVYIDEEDELLPPPPPPGAFDTSGLPIDPPVEGFQNLGQVYGTSTSNAFTAEQDRARLQSMAPKDLMAIQKAQAEAEQAAIRFAGQQKYRKLIADGAKPEEALRLAAPDLFWNNPAGLASAIRSTRPETPFNPTVTDIEGGRLIQTGPNRVQFDRTRPPAMPPDVKAKQDILKNQLRSMTSGPLGIAADPVAVKALEEQILSNSTNWMNQANPPAPAERKLTKDLAADFLKMAKGDKDQARKLARDAGYTF
jgi:hypothetical protein